MIPVTIERVTKRFGETVALDAVDLRIEQGELFFLLGPSGCGKTTLLRSIAGFIIPDAGRILFGPDDVTRLAPHRRNTGMMFQSYALWPHMTVAKNVAFGLEQRKVTRAEITRRVGDALASVQMERHGERRINQLSGGQQQRVALARALVIRPRCLLLDEPLSNLDAKLRLEMRGTIRRVCKESGLTGIYVTHDQKEALSVADRLAILSGGRVQQVGAPAEVYRTPTSAFVADFIGETNFIEGKVTRAGRGEVCVETPLGEFVSTAPARDWKAGESVTLSIRPESWRLGSERPAVNGVAGRIGDTIYLGEMAQYQFQTHGRGLKIVELNPRFIAAGDRELHASAAPEDVIVLPPGDA